MKHAELNESDEPDGWNGMISNSFKPGVPPLREYWRMREAVNDNTMRIADEKKKKKKKSLNKYTVTNDAFQQAWIKLKTLQNSRKKGFKWPTHKMAVGLSQCFHFRS